MTQVESKAKGIDLEFATDHIWTMEDKEGFIGLRVDCGDHGVIYFTPQQAMSVICAFSLHLQPSGLVVRTEIREKADDAAPGACKSDRNNPTPHASDCNVWVGEPCNCIVGKM